MKRSIASVVAAVRKARAASQDIYWGLVDNSLVGKWIPAPNVLAGLVAGALVAAARKVGVLDSLPAGWSEAVAGAVVTYWVGPPKFIGTLTLVQPTIEDGWVTPEEASARLSEVPPPASQDNAGLVD
jgi:hypothetical protein